MLEGNPTCPGCGLEMDGNTRAICWGCRKPRDKYNLAMQKWRAGKAAEADPATRRVVAKAARMTKQEQAAAELKSQRAARRFGKKRPKLTPLDGERIILMMQRGQW